MSSNPPISPPLNCAAEICCGDREKANIAFMEVLADCGCPEEYRAQMVKKMRQLDLVVLTGDLARAIKAIAFGK